jgi:pyruvyltransferase
MLDGLRQALGLTPPRSVVSLTSWRPDRRRNNFGDALSAVVVGGMLARRGLTLASLAVRPRSLLAIGSILHFAREGDVVWGTGLNGKVPASAHRFRALDVRAVRGPLTRAFLADRGVVSPAVYGDPALLLPTLFSDRFQRHDDVRLSVIPNLHDLPLVVGRPDVVSPLDPWDQVIDRLLRSRFVVASSLHGVIVAEAFGVPARFVRLSGTESRLKYEDYLLGTGRTDEPFATSIDEALEMGGMSAPEFDTAGLMAAFPFDLWPAGQRDSKNAR